MSEAAAAALCALLVLACCSFVSSNNNTQHQVPLVGEGVDIQAAAEGAAAKGAADAKELESLLHWAIGEASTHATKGSTMVNSVALLHYELISSRLLTTPRGVQ